MNKRNLKLDAYGISGKRYKELSGFCEQYPEWVETLRNQSYVSGVASDGMPKAQYTKSDATGRIAVKMNEIRKRKQLIDDVAKEASPDLCRYIIKSVCYEVPFWYLQDFMKIPCGRNTFYDARWFFFYLLDRRKF
jgi:hypothetical protein